MFEFAMPSLGADMEAGTFVEWLVKPGQEVKRGDVVCVVETEKGAVEVEIWESGKIARLVSEPGQVIPVGKVLALVATEGEDVAEIARMAPKETVTPPVASVPTAPAMAQAPALVATRIKASPAARKRAAEIGVDLAKLTPSGADGVISVQDVERAAIRGAEEAVAVPDRKRTMRDAIGAAMARSKREIPHYYLGTEINVERASVWLEQYNAARSVDDRMLFAVMELKAVALALRDVPQLNGKYAEGKFYADEGIHLGVATSLRGGGLIAPALRDADKLALPELMMALRDLVTRARAGQLRSSEYTDATITVTNLGDLGVETVLGVIYPPQVALAGFGRVKAKPWVEGGAIVAARIVHATLSADHRVTDGMIGARFLSSLTEKLSHPEAL